jgi:hypothetical protein
MKKTYFIFVCCSLFFTVNLIYCTTEFQAGNGIHYKFKDNHIEWIKKIHIKNLKTEITTEKNVECETSGHCCGYGGCGYSHDCDGIRKFVTYKYTENLVRKDLKLKGGRTIKGKEYIEETEVIVDQARCVQI